MFGSTTLNRLVRSVSESLTRRLAGLQHESHIDLTQINVTRTNISIFSDTQSSTPFVTQVINPLPSINHFNINNSPSLTNEELLQLQSQPQPQLQLQSQFKCQHVKRSGKFRGDICNKDASYDLNGAKYCRVHFNMNSTLVNQTSSQELRISGSSESHSSSSSSSASSSVSLPSSPLSSSSSSVSLPVSLPSSPLPSSSNQSRNTCQYVISKGEQKGKLCGKHISSRSNSYCSTHIRFDLSLNSPNNSKGKAPLQQEPVQIKKSEFSVLSEKENLGQCKICMSNIVNIAFIPCGHVSCLECCIKLENKCHICRKTIARALPIYL